MHPRSPPARAFLAPLPSGNRRSPADDSAVASELTRASPPRPAAAAETPHAKSAEDLFPPPSSAPSAPLSPPRASAAMPPTSARLTYLPISRRRAGAIGAVPSPQSRHAPHRAHQLFRQQRLALLKIRLQNDLCKVTLPRARTHLHRFVDQQHVPRAGPIGKQRRPKCKSIHRPAYTQSAPLRPHFLDVERNPRYGPAQLGAIRL